MNYWTVLLLFIEGHSLVHCFGQASPIRLPLTSGGFVQLLVGYPGVQLHLQLNFTLNCLELYSPLIQRSQSSTFYEDGTGEEIFYLNADVGIWLPYELNQNPQRDSHAFFSQGDGSLGLGRYSPLWRFYQNYTLTSKYLYFNTYDRYSQLDPHTRVPVISTNHPTYCSLPNGDDCTVVLDPGRMDTYFPRDLYEHPPAYVTILSSECRHRYRELGVSAVGCHNEEVIYFPYKSLKSVNGIESKVTKVFEGEEIRLGLHYLLSDYSLFFDRAAGLQFFVKSAFSFAVSPFIAFYVLLLAMTLVIWGMIVVSDEYGTEWALNLTLMLELYGYLIIGIAWLSTIFGLRWTRLVGNFFGADPKPFLVFVTLILLVCFVGSLCLLKRFNLHILDVPYAHRKVENFRIAKEIKFMRLLFFPIAAIITLWLCVVQHHNTLGDVVYLLGFTTSNGILVTLLAFNAYVYSQTHSWLFYIAVVPIYIFLWVTLVPLLEIISIHESAIIIRIGYTAFMVLMPSIWMFMKAESNYAESAMKANTAAHQEFQKQLQGAEN